MRQDEIRKEFPIFAYDPSLVYLDNAATTQKPQEMLNRMNQYYMCENANIHRGNYPLSNRADQVYEDSRQTVCEWLDAESKEEIVYTKSSTEAINLIAYTYRSLIKPCENVVITELEHSSNYFPWKELCRRTGAEFRVAKATEYGTLELEEIQRLIDGNTKLVAVTGMSNVTGFMPDLKAIIGMAHEQGALVLVDGTQLVVHKKISVKELDCDFMCFSAHKMYGPMGLGVLYGKLNLLEQMPPFLFGGDMVARGEQDEICYRKSSRKYEAGTQNLAAAAGLKAAIDFLKKNRFEDMLEEERKLTIDMREAISEMNDIQILNRGRDSPIMICKMNHFGAYDLGVLLGLKNIAVRCGAHCAYPLMKRMKAQGICRISLGIYNNKEDIKKLVTALKELKGL